jgi:hypothetical protein
MAGRAQQQAQNGVAAHCHQRRAMPRLLAMDHSQGSASGPARDTTPFASTLIGIGAATAAAHIGNNFTTYLVGGLMDRFGFTPFAMGAWNMAETLSYAAAMFLVAPRARGLDARVLAMIASLVVITAQAGSALTGAYPLLFMGRIGTGLGFGLMNSALNLAAGRTGNPARWISLGIAVQTLLYSGIAILVPLIGRDYGAGGMFFGLAGISVLFGLCALLLPGGKGAAEEQAQAAAPIGAEGGRVLAAMALFAFGSLAIWPFIERTAHAIGIPATQFGLYQSAAVLASAVGNAGLALVIGRLPRAWPLAAALGVCSVMCGLLDHSGQRACLRRGLRGLHGKLVPDLSAADPSRLCAAGRGAAGGDDFGHLAAFTEPWQPCGGRDGAGLWRLYADRAGGRRDLPACDCGRHAGGETAGPGGRRQRLSDCVKNSAIASVAKQSRASRTTALDCFATLAMTSLGASDEGDASLRQLSANVNGSGVFL